MHNIKKIYKNKIKSTILSMFKLYILTNKPNINKKKITVKSQNSLKL